MGEQVDSALMDMPRTPILFIGPVRAGKSTIATLVAGQLKLPHISLDDLRWHYYREVGYDDELAKQIRLQGGFLALVFYWQLFDPHAVQGIIRDHPESVIDFGAGVGAYENRETMRQIQTLLTPIPNIFLLLPSEDEAESLRILKERDPNPPADLHFDINAHFLRHPGYRSVSKHVIYTTGKTPEQSCAEVLKLLQ